MNLIISIMVYLALFTGIFTTVLYILSFFGREKKVFKAIGHPLVSILIPAYNEENSLQKTVESVAALDYPKDNLEILVIDDGSRDNTSRIGKALAKKYNNVEYFRKENGGKGSALNYGIRRAKGEFIVTFDADSFVNPDALKLMIPHFADPKVMAATCAMKIYKPKTFSQRIQSIEYDLGIFFRKAFANMNAVNVTPGPFSIIRKWFFDKYGGYDEHILTEDMEMAMRIQSHNYIIANELRAIVYTISPRNFFSLLKQRRRWYVGTMHIWASYRRLFSRKFGEFGLFMLPLAVLSVVTAISVTTYFISKGIIDSLKSLARYSIINYDFVHSLNFQLYYLLAGAYSALSQGFVVFMLSFGIFTVLLLIYLNKRMGLEENVIKTFINYIMFMAVYGILYSLWWIVSIVYILSGRKVTW